MRPLGCRSYPVDGEPNPVSALCVNYEYLAVEIQQHLCARISDPANSSSQGYHLLITCATERIPSDAAKQQPVNRFRKEAPAALWSTGLALARWLIVGQRPA